MGLFSNIEVAPEISKITKEMKINVLANSTEIKVKPISLTGFFQSSS